MTDPHSSSAPAPLTRPVPTPARPDPDQEPAGDPGDDPRREDVTAPRIGAALADLALLAGLLAVLGLAVGESRVSADRLHVTLGGGWLLAFGAAALLYYFVLEATTGQTVGKRLAGLRVAGADGGRPSVPAIARRTALRVVDLLPVLYLVGFLAMLATGRRRQRLGDLAAGTVVTGVRFPPPRGPAVAVLAVVLVAVVGLAGYRVHWPEARTYEGHGASFHYPSDWQELRVTLDRSTGGTQPLWAAGVGLDLLNTVVVGAMRSDFPAALPLDEAAVILEGILRASYEHSGGALWAGPADVLLGTLPAVRFRGTATVEGTKLEVTTVFALAGGIQYVVYCRARPERIGPVGRACEQVTRTFRVHTAAPDPPAPAPPTPTPAPTATPTRTATPTPTATPSGGLSGAELAWLAGIPSFLGKVARAFESGGDLTPGFLRGVATLFGSCRTGPGRQPPSERLQPVHQMVLRACAEYDRGARCFRTAADIGVPVAGSAAGRTLNRALDCGFEVQREGSRMLVDAMNRGEGIKERGGG